MLIGGPDGFDYPSLWENKCLGSKFFNLHVEGVGYLNRVRTIKPKKGQEFLACSVAARRGSDSGVCYTKFDCRVSGADAQGVAAFQTPSSTRPRS